MQQPPETLEQYFDRMARFNQQLRDAAAIERFKQAEGPRRERRARKALQRKLANSVIGGKAEISA